MEAGIDVGEKIYCILKTVENGVAALAAGFF
jgi:hypothetical protein